MKIDDPIEVHLEQLKQDLDMGIETDLTGATVASILSFIPGAAAAIQSLLDGRAKENVQRRWIELFVELRKQIEAIRDSIEDDCFYSLEEFQTLLALVQEQLWTTPDKEKLRMLAAALAQSGSKEFQADDKELMLRALRAISPTDLQNLNHDYLKGWLPLTRQIDYPSSSRPTPASGAPVSVWRRSGTPNSRIAASQTPLTWVRSIRATA
jgi:hypothetical protein